MARRFNFNVDLDLALEAYDIENRFSDSFESGFNFGTAFGPNATPLTVFSDNFASLTSLDVTAPFSTIDESSTNVPTLPSQPLENGPFGAVFELSSLLAANGGDGSAGFVINGIDAEDQSGRSVSSAGDINGDGFDDFIIGASLADPNGNYSGESYVVFGQVSGFGASLELSALDGTNGFVVNGVDESDFSGRSVSSAGDINGDGFDDIIIGASHADPNGNFSGESYVVFGQAGGFSASLELSSLNGTNGFVIKGIDAFDFSGYSVSSAGDINGDGFDDIVIGAEYADPNGVGNSGESYVVFGQAGGFSASLELSALDGANGFVINGIDAGDLSGQSVSSAGDVNGDGFYDILIGASGADPNGTQSGESYVLFGQASGFGASFNLSTLNGANGFTNKWYRRG